MKTKDKLLNKLIDSIGNLSKVEDGIYTYVNKLDEVNNAIFDIMHYIENHELTRNGKERIMDTLQELRIQRRDIKQMWELYNMYGNNRNKLCQRDHREFMICSLKEKDKDLDSQYRYRYYTEDQLDELNKEKKRARQAKEGACGV